MNEIKLKHKNLKYSVYNKSVQFCHINVNAYIKNQKELKDFGFKFPDLIELY